MVLVTMSLTLVFAAGRMSAWIVLVTDTPRDSAVSQQKQDT